MTCRFHLSTLLLTAALGCGATTDCERSDPSPAILSGAEALSQRTGTLSFVAKDGNTLTAATYRATGFDEATGPIVFVLHGARRDAEAYLAALTPYVERAGALAIAPTFPLELYPDSEDYTLGLGVDDPPSGGDYDPAEWRPEDQTTFMELEHLFEAIKATLPGAGGRCDYLVFGHSAGAQFTHRLLLFHPTARVRRAVAANAGWYTLPVSEAGDPNTEMPYGLTGSPVGQGDVKQALGRELIVLLGQADTATADEDPDLRGTDEAQAQGTNRLERGRHFMATVEGLGEPHRWAQSELPGAGHNVTQMAGSAAYWLFRPDGETPCQPSSAADGAKIVFNEVLADPPNDAPGDANGDGARDNLQDELVELVNVGSSAVCLAGWGLGDAEDPFRHRFPVGTSLDPGEALVVFGGGVPTGPFAGVTVQVADFDGSLNLQNAGDLLRLSTPEGDTVTALSWGDCAGSACAADHLSEDLERDAAITRSPELSGGWVTHGGAGYSPGTMADGAAFGD
ncbi:lamin tail domain-containing protein [Myxococcota bacterium]|nr:lamin tail domain-containing protein [Myxococcota bacterium]